MPLFIPKNPIETAQEFQWQIELADTTGAVKMARGALDVLGDVRTIYDSKHLIIHTLGAYVCNRKRSFYEEFEQSFGESTISGYFGGIQYVQGGTTPRLQSLVVDLFDVQFHDPSDVKDQFGGKVRAPLTIPVTDIMSVMVLR